MSDTSIDLSIIIVGYRSQHTLPDCLQSVQSQSNVSIEIIYIDNDCQHSALDLVDSVSPHATVIESPSNLGFGRACNQAAEQARGEFLLFLNPDAMFMSNAVCADLIKALRQQPAIGILSPQICNARGEPQKNARAGYYGQHVLGPVAKDLPGEVAWVSGAAMLIQRQRFVEIGGFDPAYFMYAEDQDICLRVRQAGYTVAELETVSVKHIGGESAKNWRPTEMYQRLEEANIIFLKKFYSTQQVRRYLEHRYRRYRRKYWLARLLGRQYSQSDGIMKAVRVAIL